jgi:hypothetical protein
MNKENGRPQAANIIHFYRILTMDTALVITRFLEFVHHLSMQNYTEYQTIGNAPPNPM